MAEIKVEYVDHMGSDLSVVNAARISLGSGSPVLSEKDHKLIAYLAKNKHMSPFEHCILTAKISCPLYIRSQIMRHRTFSYNEISRRYTSEKIEFYVPRMWKNQAKTNRQASSEPTFHQTASCEIFAKGVFTALDSYNALLELGISREQARAVLPQALMTEFFMTGNLRNWSEFIKLRDSEHAQDEARTIAQLAKGLLMDQFPVSTYHLMEER